MRAVFFASRVPAMSVSGFTPPKVAGTPSTGTSSGSYQPKEPEATRQKLELGSASTASSVPRSSAQLLTDLRAGELNNNKGAGEGGSVVLGYPLAGRSVSNDDFHTGDNNSEPEAVGSDTSSGSWQPRPRGETLQGPDFEAFQKGQKGPAADGVLARSRLAVPSFPCEFPLRGGS